MMTCRQENGCHLKHFSIQKDIDYKIIETLKQIKEINPDVTFFASPWSPQADENV
jgi:beta-glucosidase